MGKCKIEHCENYSDISSEYICDICYEEYLAGRLSHREYSALIYYEENKKDKKSSTIKKTAKNKELNFHEWPYLLLGIAFIVLMCAYPPVLFIVGLCTFIYYIFKILKSIIHFFFKLNDNDPFTKSKRRCRCCRCCRCRMGDI